MCVLHPQPTVVEDLLIGGTAGAAAAAVTTPLDVVKTVMMCSASSRPTLASASARVMAEGRGAAPFFRGVGPRSLSNGLNSAIFFCFFEALRGVRNHPMYLVVSVYLLASPVLARQLSTEKRPC